MPKDPTAAQWAPIFQFPLSGECPECRSGCSGGPEPGASLRETPPAHCRVATSRQQVQQCVAVDLQFPLCLHSSGSDGMIFAHCYCWTLVGLERGILRHCAIGSPPHLVPLKARWRLLGHHAVVIVERMNVYR